MSNNKKDNLNTADKAVNNNPAGEEDTHSSANKFSQENRSLYVGNLPYETTYYDLCKVAHEFGPLELVRLVPRKRCAFLNFVNIEDAKAMMTVFAHVTTNGKFETEGKKILRICGRTCKLSWSETKEIPPDVLKELNENGASRNLFVFYGNCSGMVTSHELAEKFKKFGNIENIVVKEKKNIAFVNMTSLASSVEIVKRSKEIEKIMKGKYKMPEDLASKYEDLFLHNGYLVAKYSTEEKIRENYTYEKYNPKNQPFSWNQPVIPRNPYYNVGVVQPIILQEKEVPLPPGWMSSFDEKTGCKYYYNSQKNVTQWEHPITGKASPPIKSPPVTFVSNSSTTRSLNLQNLPPSINYAKLCTLGRQHGLIESVRIMQHKKMAFINYINAQSAWSLFSLSQRLPITVDGYNLKISWAKDVGLNPELYEAIVQYGANRSVYLRDLDPSFTEEDIQTEFERFTETETESIVLRPQEKPFGFVNFINVASAKAVVDAGKENNGCYTFPDGRTVHVSYVNVKQKVFGQNNYAFTDRYQNFRQPQQCRSVIISGFPNETTTADISALGSSFGNIESVHLIPEKNHAFINYISPDSATKFMGNSNSGPGFTVRGTVVRVGFGKSVPIKPDILLALEVDGASRSIYVSGVTGKQDEIEEKLRDLVVHQCKDDEIESINVNAENNFAFITLTSIAAAKKVVSTYKKLEIGDGVVLKFSYARPQALNSV